MQAILLATFYGLSLLIVGGMLYRYITGKAELVSLFTLVMLGFVKFQLLAFAVVVRVGSPPQPAVTDVMGTGLVVAFWSVVFLAVAALAYAITPVVRTAAARVPEPPLPMREDDLIKIALICFAGAVFLYVTARFIPVVGLLMNYGRSGLFAAAAGIAVWWWASDWRNVIRLVIAGGISFASLLGAQFGEYSRRPMLSVAIAAAGAAYFRLFRYMRPMQVIPLILLLSVPGIVAVGAYTGIRGQIRDQGWSSPAAFAEALVSSVSNAALEELVAGSDTGPVSMWLLETHPSVFEYRHLNTLRYFLLFPVPRSLFEGKGEPLSGRVASMAQYRRVTHDFDVNSGVTIGPGIIGHAAAEGGFYALVLYAAFTGIFLRFYDELLRRNPFNPLMVIPWLSAGGQIFGYARGETAAFASIHLMTTAIVFGILYLIGAFGPAVGIPTLRIPRPGRRPPDEDEPALVPAAPGTWAT